MSTQLWNPLLYNQKHAYVFAYGEDLLSLLLPSAGEDILDVGCGTGRLTSRIAESGAHVIGIDQSPEMIAAAKEAYPNIEFMLADVTDFSSPHQFDGIFSNAAFHWILDPDRAVACLATALRPGGRFVVEFGAKGNVARVADAIAKNLQLVGHSLTEPVWYYPSIGEFTSLLERHGLLVRSAGLFDRPTKMEAGEEGLRNWLEMFGGRLLNHLEPEVKRQVIAGVESDLRPLQFKDDSWFMDYRRLRIVAEK